MVLDCPVNIKEVPNTLMGFRSHKVSITGDASKMFLRLKTRKEDTPMLSFLWRKGQGNIKVMEFSSHLLGKKDSPYICIEVMNAQATKYEFEFPIGSGAIKNSVLVDDLLKSTPDLEKAKTLYQQVMKVY